MKRESTYRELIRLMRHRDGGRVGPGRKFDAGSTDSDERRGSTGVTAEGDRVVGIDGPLIDLRLRTNDLCRGRDPERN